MKLSVSTKLSVNMGLGVAVLLIGLTSVNSAMADQPRNLHHQQGGKQVEVTKEVTADGVIIHKTITKANGETFTIDKKIKTGRHGSVDIEKKRNGRIIEEHHHSR